jgi:hypothetical protein
MQKKKNLLTFDDLNKRLQNFYIKNAKEQMKEELGYTDAQINAMK